MQTDNDSDKDEIRVNMRKDTEYHLELDETPIFLLKGGVDELFVILMVFFEVNGFYGRFRVGLLAKLKSSGF